MNYRLSRGFIVLLASAMASWAGFANADSPAPAEFAWRAPVELPQGASLVRATLPAQALTALQSSDARDLRIFNAAGEAVPFAFMAPPRAPDAPPPARTASYPALPLYSSAAKASRPKGAMEVRIQGGDNQGSVWVKMDGAETPGAAKLNAALFATKGERQAITGLELQAALPANTPVRISVATSADLAQWTPEPVRGRIYRFEGPDAPVNMTLEFERPVPLEGRYLRIDWDGQPGVTVSSVTGLVGAVAKPVPRVRAELPAPVAADKGAVEIATGFLTPLAALSFATPRDNSLLPIRILGRNEVSQPWRVLAHTAVWRLGAGADAATNPPVMLRGVSARWLRLESTTGSDLGAAQLQAAAEFEPVQIVFLASGAGPFDVAAGRAGTTSAALPLPAMADMLQGRKLDELPSARIGAGARQALDAGPLARMWPGAPPGKTAVLWAVLLVGMLLLAAVAWSLMRQLKTAAPKE